MVIVLIAFLSTILLIQSIDKPQQPGKPASSSLKEVKDIDRLVNDYNNLVKSLHDYEKINNINFRDKTYIHRPENSSYSISIEMPQVGVYAKKNKSDNNLTDITTKITRLLVDSGFTESIQPTSDEKRTAIFDSDSIVCKLVSAEAQKDVAAYSATYCARKDKDGPFYKQREAIDSLLAISSDKDMLVADAPIVTMSQVSEDDKKLITLEFSYFGKLPSTAYFAAIDTHVEYLGSTMHGSYDNDKPTELPQPLLQAASNAQYGDFLKKQLRL